MIFESDTTMGEWLGGEFWAALQEKNPDKQLQRVKMLSDDKVEGSSSDVWDWLRMIRQGTEIIKGFRSAKSVARDSELFGVLDAEIKKEETYLDELLLKLRIRVRVFYVEQASDKVILEYNKLQDKIDEGNRRVRNHDC